jgi:hypothetical protein
MNLPKFLLADNSNSPEDIFVLHTEFPRFMINLKDDEIEWFEDLTGKNSNKYLYLKTKNTSHFILM